jgi:hypothetical protein
MSWAVIEMVLLLLDKIWKEREEQRVVALQQRHRSAIRAARRHANQVRSRRHACSAQLALASISPRSKTHEGQHEPTRTSV